VNRTLAYVPVEELGDRPHVLVDGAARPESVLTLSHWPQSPTPRSLARDLSTEIVFAFLHAARGDAVSGKDRRSNAEIRSAIAAADLAEAVSNDHFDEDGLVSVFAMTDPETALRHEELLVDVASCGDFGVVRSRIAARIAFTIAPLGERGQELRAKQDGAATGPASWTGTRYQAVLEQIVELLERPEAFRRYWEERDAAFAASLEDLRTGLVRIDEVPHVDLAVVTRDGPVARARAEAGSAVALDEAALHSATSASRILAFDGDRCELYLRYESWVRYVSRHVPLRPDLAPLAEQLSSAEPTGIRWTADGVGSIVPRMLPEPDGRTDLDPKAIAEVVVRFLQSAPAAWDPFRRGGALIPSGRSRPS